MTLLAVSVFGDSFEQVRSEIDTAVELGADLVELRVDLMENLTNDEIRSLRQHRPSDLPLILTIRTKAEGGAWDGPDDQRISRIIELAPAAAYIDVELATWQRSANIRQKIRQALTRTGQTSQSGADQETTTATGPRLILSRHNLASRPPKLQTDFLAMLGESLAPSPAKKTIPKLVWPARTVRDNFEALELLRQSPRPPIIICTGDEGLASRVLARKFGAFATFAAVAAGREAAAGQPSIADMKNLYRWDTIDAQTRVYGVLGDPVHHSLSPRLHNAAFAATGENAVYLPWRILGSYESFKAFMVEVAARPWLDFRGFSVTIPHKQNALRFLHETGGTIDPLAGRIGALNTLTLAPDGHLTGHNTDCPAALEAITTGLACQDTDLADLRVAVLGAGGVARGVVAGLADAGADITIFNRTEARAEALSGTFACRHRPWKDRLATDAALLVNCTSVGLWPDIGASPLPADALVPGMTVFDTIYNPRQTRLLREAAHRGCATIDGLSMFILQARSQFELWTGHRLSPEVFRLAAETQPERR